MDIQSDATIMEDIERMQAEATRCTLCHRPAFLACRWQAGEVGGIAWVCQQHLSRQQEACEASVRRLLAPLSVGAGAAAEAGARAGQGEGFTIMQDHPTEARPLLPLTDGQGEG
jgi:hypothetical protein